MKKRIKIKKLKKQLNAMSEEQKDIIAYTLWYLIQTREGGNE